MDGISLTHGHAPRQHIWTFANALDAVASNEWVCPCTRPDLEFTGAVQPFIRQDYFCDTAVGTVDGRQLRGFYPNDPLWDGHGCEGNHLLCLQQPPVVLQAAPSLNYR